MCNNCSRVVRSVTITFLYHHTASNLQHSQAGSNISGLQGIARTQSPLRTNYALESPTFVAIAGVNPPGGAMDRPRPGRTSLLIRVLPVPGKYDSTWEKPMRTVNYVTEQNGILSKHTKKQQFSLKFYNILDNIIKCFI